MPHNIAARDDMNATCLTVPGCLSHTDASSKIASKFSAICPVHYVGAHFCVRGVCHLEFHRLDRPSLTTRMHRCDHFSSAFRSSQLFARGGTGRLVQVYAHARNRAHAHTCTLALALRTQHFYFVRGASLRDISSLRNPDGFISRESSVEGSQSASRKTEERGAHAERESKIV
jgi:hypothetical protein